MAVPQLSSECLMKGHAVHFKCNHPEAMGSCIDVMSIMCGVALFRGLSFRRTVMEPRPEMICELISL
jgi:hypothetical protein